MVTGNEATDSEATRRYLVECEACPFERTVEGREQATRVGDRHRWETSHELVALELPRATGPPRE